MSNPLFGKDTKKSLHDLAVALRRDREQLMVQLNLGKMELRDEWQEVEKKWQAFEHKVDEANDDAKQSLHQVGQEIAETYRKLKNSG